MDVLPRVRLVPYLLSPFRHPSFLLLSPSHLTPNPKSCFSSLRCDSTDNSLSLEPSRNSIPNAPRSTPNSPNSNPSPSSLTDGSFGRCQASEGRKGSGEVRNLGMRSFSRWRSDRGRCEFDASRSFPPSSLFSRDAQSAFKICQNSGSLSFLSTLTCLPLSHPLEPPTSSNRRDGISVR